MQLIHRPSAAHHWGHRWFQLLQGAKPFACELRLAVNPMTSAHSQCLRVKVHCAVLIGQRPSTPTGRFLPV